MIVTQRSGIDDGFCVHSVFPDRVFSGFLHRFTSRQNHFLGKTDQRLAGGRKQKGPPSDWYRGGPLQSCSEVAFYFAVAFPILIKLSAMIPSPNDQDPIVRRKWPEAMFWWRPADRT